MYELIIDNNSINWAILLALIFSTTIVGFAAGGLPGAGSLAAPILTLVLPFEKAQAIAVPLLIIGQLFPLLFHREFVKKKQIIPIVLICSIGTIIGSILWYFCIEYTNYNQVKKYFKLFTAVLIILLICNIYRTKISKKTIPPISLGKVGGFLWYTFCGICSTIANISGPLVVWHLSTKKLSKEELTTTVAISFAFINIIKIPFYTLLGFYTLFESMNSINQNNQINYLDYKDILIIIILLLFGILSVLIGKKLLLVVKEIFFNIALISAMFIVVCMMLRQVFFQL